MTFLSFLSVFRPSIKNFLVNWVEVKYSYLRIVLYMGKRLKLFTSQSGGSIRPICFLFLIVGICAHKCHPGFEINLLQCIYYGMKFMNPIIRVSSADLLSFLVLGASYSSPGFGINQTGRYYGNKLYETTNKS